MLSLCKNMKLRITYLIILLLFLNIDTTISQKNYNIRTIAFYNLENLFDTINDINKDDEASPIMKIKHNKSKVYWDKIDKLASTISKIGYDKTNNSPVVIGIAEVENLNVIEDLVKSKHLIKKNYNIIHYDSPDKRGIDVALLYQKEYFNPIHHETFNPNIYKNNYPVYTRDQLLVSGYLDDELIHLIINHWPSRSGGEYKSRFLREKAAYKNTQIIQQIRKNDKHAKIIVMGDFNDDPINSSLKKVLSTVSNKNNITIDDLYNPYENMFKKGYNTLGYRDNINLFDMLILTGAFLSPHTNDYKTYTLYQSNIYNKRYLTTTQGKYKGYPFRSFSNGVYTGGYSDHYPVYIYLIKKVRK